MNDKMFCAISRSDAPAWSAQTSAAGERWMAAEFLRLHARLSRRAGRPLEAVRAGTREAIAVASSQGASLFLERSRADLECWA